MKRIVLIALVLVMAFSIMATAVSAQIDTGIMPVGDGLLLPAVQTPRTFSWGAVGSSFNFSSAP